MTKFIREQMTTRPEGFVLIDEASTEPFKSALQQYPALIALAFGVPSNLLEQKGTDKMLKPFLVIAFKEVEGETPVTLYYSKDEPVFAVDEQEARQFGFAEAVRADPKVASKDVKVFLLPFR